MKPREWLLSLVSVVLLSTASKADPCGETFTGECVKSLECFGSDGNYLDIWENCAGTLFTVEDGSILKEDPSCPFLSLSGDSKSIVLSSKQDAEEFQGEKQRCLLNEAIQTYVVFKDINEFKPSPEDGNPVSEVRFKENQPDETEVTRFTYIDEDFGETDTLDFAWVSTSEEFADTFILEQESNTFILSTIKSLDYEIRIFYKLDFNIISKDEQETEKNTTHTVLITVEDVGDMPPYWIQSPPVAQLEEGLSGRSVYQVIAEDRDVDINNAIKYTLQDGDGFFDIDEDTGEVTLVKDIDHEKDKTFFPLTVIAQEYLDDGTMAPEPSSILTITNLNIIDINDESPKFNMNEYEAIIDEVTDHDIFIDVTIYVTDADSTGNYNLYNVTSDHADYLEILPEDPRGNTSIQIKVLADVEETVFDYETALDPIVVTLTATEVENPLHVHSATLTITVKDVNDHKPKFESSTYESQISEDKGAGFSVAVVAATDGDRSEEFGTASIVYGDVTCPNILDVNIDSGEVYLARDNALDFEVSNKVTCTIYAYDNEQGAGFKSASSEIIIDVGDVNDSPPSITNAKDGDILENSPIGSMILDDIEAKDPDTTAVLTFDIDWESSYAFKDDVQIDKEKVKKWFDIQLTNVLEDISSASLMVGEASPDREVADEVRLSIRVRDTKTDTGFPDIDQKTLTITINDENDCDPTFFGDYSNLNVTETSKEGFVFGSLLTKDEDEADRMRFSIDDASIVHIVQGVNFDADLVVSDGAVIDREKTDTISVTITVTDKADHETSQEFTIKVIDVNDNPPIFREDVLLASFTSGSTIGTNLKTFSAQDLDLNEVLSYAAPLNDFQWHDCETEPTADVPFRVRKNEDGDAELIMNFEPDGIDSGYCNFTITATDNDGVHVTSIEGKVYAITVDYQINAGYDNPLSDVQSHSIEISSAFSKVYGYQCIIDNMAKGESDDKTVVKMHFIDEDKNEPVQADEIKELTKEAEIVQNIIDENKKLGLTLTSVEGNLPDSGSTIDDVLLLQILLGVVSLVLGSLLLLLLITYCIKTRSLSRRLKVANTTNFGSMSSDLNRMDLSGVPGSNKFASEGANPMYNLKEADLRNDDTSSMDSGDSVLVGVEDNPEFRGYSDDHQRNFEGQSNPAFGRSIDDVAAPSPFSGGTKMNPLMDADLGGTDDIDLSDALQNYNMFVRRQSGSSGGSGYSGGPASNPNFSFGEKL